MTQLPRHPHNPGRHRPLDRLVRKAASLWRRPKLRMTIELTNKCNFRCTYCPHSTRGLEVSDDLNRFDRPLGFMSEATFDLALANARKYADTLSFGFFGEQMLHPRFSELIYSIPRNRPYRLVISTNGSLLTERNLETLKRFDLVRFSIDSTDSDSFERLRPGGAILTINGQRGDDRFGTLAEQIERWLSLPDHPQTQLVHVTTDFNREDRQRHLDHWLPMMGPDDCVVLKSVISYGGVMKDPYMTANPCTIPEDGRINVAFNGDVTPCNLDVNIALCAGNVHQTPDLMEMMRTPQYKAVMEGIRRNQGICRNCHDANNHQESMLYWGERGTGRHGETRALTRPEILAMRGLTPPTSPTPPAETGRAAA
jgi:radical SAM protein with 4Fe4S-binding SPASM domain